MLVAAYSSDQGNVHVETVEDDRVAEPVGVAEPAIAGRARPPGSAAEGRPTVLACQHCDLDPVTPPRFGKV